VTVFGANQQQEAEINGVVAGTWVPPVPQPPISTPGEPAKANKVSKDK
jgi:hypothetical protein